MIIVIYYLYHRYIKRILGDEDDERFFNKRGRWGRGRGNRGRGRGRGGYHQQREGGPWRNRRGRRHNDRGGRNGNPAAIKMERDSQSAESPTKSEEKQLSVSGEINPADCELENDLNNSVVNAIMADVASAAATSQCSDRQETETKKEGMSNQVTSGLVPVPVEEEKVREKPHSNSGGGGGGKAAVSRKRKEMEGGRKRGSRRQVKQQKRKKVMDSSLV